MRKTKEPKVLTITSMEEMQKHYEILLNAFVFNQSVTIKIENLSIKETLYVNGDLKVKAMKANNIICKGDIDCITLRCSSVEACRIDAEHLIADNIIKADTICTTVSVGALMVDVKNIYTTFLDTSILYADNCKVLTLRCIRNNAVNFSAAEYENLSSPVMDYKDTTGIVEACRYLIDKGFTFFSSLNNETKHIYAVHLEHEYLYDLNIYFKDKYIVADIHFDSDKVLNSSDDKYYVYERTNLSEKVPNEPENVKRVIECLLLKAEMFCETSKKGD